MNAFWSIWRPCDGRKSGCGRQFYVILPYFCSNLQLKWRKINFLYLLGTLDCTTGHIWSHRSDLKAYWIKIRVCDSEKQGVIANYGVLWSYEQAHNAYWYLLYIISVVQMTANSSVDAHLNFKPNKIKCKWWPARAKKLYPSSLDKTNKRSFCGDNL